MRDNTRSSFKGITIIFILGVLLLSYFIFKILNKTPTTPPDEALLLVSSRDLNQGDVISMPEMQWKEFTSDKIKSENVQKNEHDVVRAIEGAIVRVPILKGEPINENDIIKTGTKSALSTVVRHGMRAVPVPFSKLSNAPTLISPGDVVDIIIPKRKPGQQQGPDVAYEAQTILKGIRILAVDTALQKAELSEVKGTSHTITLEVNAEQAEALAESIRQGQIVISMHSVFGGEDDVLAQPKSEDMEKAITNKADDKEEAKIVKVVRGTDKKTT